MGLATESAGPPPGVEAPGFPRAAPDECRHQSAGHRFRSASGLYYQWCSPCGAMGVSKEAKAQALFWVMPGELAEDQIIDLVSALK